MKLTVIIIDDSPLRYEESQIRRSVQIELTQEQEQKLFLNGTGWYSDPEEPTGKKFTFERIEQCFIES